MRLRRAARAAAILGIEVGVLVALLTAAALDEVVDAVLWLVDEYQEKRP